jgi:hypothetical protein
LEQKPQLYSQVLDKLHYDHVQAVETAIKNYDIKRAVLEDLKNEFNKLRSFLAAAEVTCGMIHELDY